MRPLRAVPQHRQEIQADQMRDPLLVGTRPFVSQLTAEHARGRQRRLEAALGRRFPPGDRQLAKQIAGLLVSAYAIRHIAPRIVVTRIVVTDGSPSPVECSFRFAGQEVLS
jgi:hypothetical protein